MSEVQDTEERPCLHCMMVELIENFFAEYPTASGEPDTIDTDEVIIALAKTVADLTCGQNSTVRQQIIETLMRQIMNTMQSFVARTHQVRSPLLHGTSGQRSRHRGRADKPSSAPCHVRFGSCVDVYGPRPIATG